MKRPLSFVLVVWFLLSFIPLNAQEPLGLGSGACGELTAENHRTDACDSEMNEHPLPDLVSPVEYNQEFDVYAHPRGVLLPQSSTAYPIAWQKRPWYFSDAPGVLPADNDWTNARRIDRYIMYYIYQWVEVDHVIWYLIGPGQWMDAQYVSVLQIPTRPAEVTGAWIVIDQTQQVIIAMVDDQPIWAGLVSTGYWLDTVNGLFRIYARTLNMTMIGPPGANPPRYILPNTAYVMFFNGNEGVHGAYYHNSFGLKRSHGCVNLVPSEAKWLWDFTDTYAVDWDTDLGSFAVDHPEQAPWVLVYESSPYLTVPVWGA